MGGAAVNLLHIQRGRQRIGQLEQSRLFAQAELGLGKKAAVFESIGCLVSDGLNQVGFFVVPRPLAFHHQFTQNLVAYHERNDMGFPRQAGCGGFGGDVLLFANGCFLATRLHSLLVKMIDFAQVALLLGVQLGVVQSRPNCFGDEFHQIAVIRLELVGGVAVDTQQASDALWHINGSQHFRLHGHEVEVVAVGLVGFFVGD